MLYAVGSWIRIIKRLLFVFIVFWCLLIFAMFHVSRDSNCFQMNEFVDDNPRTSGVYELFELFVWPAAGIIIMFAILLLNNYANLEKQKDIHKRFYTSSVQSWHMHSDLKLSLDGLRKSEKFKREEFAEAALDAGEVEKALEHSKTQVAKMKAEKEVLAKEYHGRKNHELLFQHVKDLDEKMANKEKAEKIKKKMDELDKEINKTEYYHQTREHKYGGVFSRQEAGSILWSPADTVLNHLMNKRLVKKRKVWHEVKTATLDDIYR